MTLPRTQPPQNPYNRGPLGALSEWTDDVGRWVGDMRGKVGRMFEPTLRLGVTGLSRAGKTVFITSTVANLLRRGRLPGLQAEAEGRILAAALTPQPDMDAPRFDYERHLADLYARDPQWPESTRAIGRLRISLRYRPAGLIGRMTGDAALHLDVVDYPGEWLLDLGLLSKSYADWSAEALTIAERRGELAATFLHWVRETDFSAGFDEVQAQAGASAYAGYLRAAKAKGFASLAPGRFLLPGDLEGAPALTFAPLPASEAAGRGAFAKEMARRFEGYKRVVVKPFFQDHFAKLDRQIVLVDALSAISRGPEATADMGDALKDILACFRPGEKSWLASVLGPALGGRRIDRLLMAVTKADHIHHTSHPALQTLARDLLSEVDRSGVLQGGGGGGDGDRRFARDHGDGDPPRGRAFAGGARAIARDRQGGAALPR